MVMMVMVMPSAVTMPVVVVMVVMLSHNFYL